MHFHLREPGVHLLKSSRDIDLDLHGRCVVREGELASRIDIPLHRPRMAICGQTLGEALKDRAQPELGRLARHPCLDQIDKILRKVSLRIRPVSIERGRPVGLAGGHRICAGSTNLVHQFGYAQRIPSLVSQPGEATVENEDPCFCVTADEGIADVPELQAGGRAQVRLVFRLHQAEAQLVLVIDQAMTDEVEQGHISDIVKHLDQPVMQVVRSRRILNHGDLLAGPAAKVTCQ